MGARDAFPIPFSLLSMVELTELDVHGVEITEVDKEVAIVDFEGAEVGVAVEGGAMLVDTGVVSSDKEEGFVTGVVITDTTGQDDGVEEHEAATMTEGVSEASGLLSEGRNDTG